MEPRPVSESRSVLAHWMGVTDANGAGNIHGGTIMKLVDEAAGLAAMKYSRSRVVTVSMDRMDFLVPIAVGELVTFRATVNCAWRTSMEVGVRVEAERPITGEVRHTNTAYLTMVAIDANGRPIPVPPPVAAAGDEQRRMRQAEMRRSNRLGRARADARAGLRPRELEADRVARLEGAGGLQQRMPARAGAGNRLDVTLRGGVQADAGDLEEGVPGIGEHRDPLTDPARRPSSRTGWSPSRS